MTIVEIIAGAAVTALSGYIALLERRLTNMQRDIANRPTRSEIDHTIDTKQEAQRVLAAELKEDIKEMKQDIKTIRDALNKS